MILPFMILVITSITACESAKSDREVLTSDVSETVKFKVKNRERVVEDIRTALRDHKKRVIIRVTSPKSATDDIRLYVDDMIEDSLAETEDPTEGDYIRFQYGGYKTNILGEPGDDIYRYTITITPEYYTYKVWEEEVDIEIGKIIEELELKNNISDKEKVIRIHDFIQKNIKYDRIHEKKNYSHMRSTAYNALKYHTVTCQGYAVLAYRLFREAGLESRIITGDATSPAGDTQWHAWNIVQVDGKWYNIDTTWDAVTQTDEYLLKTDEEFKAHTRDEKYNFLTDN